ncbi:MAG TPA: WhiB family transcriptional regulator [Micromonosporaceae bacterium]|nr:WhiB family transcriptional regulator [Micromonosporaceae bacterium]
MTDLDWRTLAACAKRPDDWLTPPARPVHGVASEEYRRARTAIRACEACPVLAQCNEDRLRRTPVGMIQAGVPYDDYGQPARRCTQCPRFIVCRDVRSDYCSRKCQEVAKAARAEQWQAAA